MNGERPMKKGKTKKPPGEEPKKRPCVRINRPYDVKRLLTRCVNQTLKDELSTDKLRAVSYACQCILKVFELVTLEERLCRIEEALKNR